VPRLRSWLVACGLSSLAGCNCGTGATFCGNDGGVTWLGPSRYLSRADSPFPCGGATEFHFDDFEDHTIDLPGVSLNAVLGSSSYPGIIDSVDGDDGVIDGTCHKADGGLCDSLFAPGGPAGAAITLRFDAGSLPTFVGLVWTDGLGQLSFEAFDADGGRLGGIGPVSDPNPDGGFPDTSVTSTTLEDRFFGVVWPGGISSVRMSNSVGGIEIDHVQYGR
jgi:hypothetical protein